MAALDQGFRSIAYGFGKGLTDYTPMSAGAVALLRFEGEAKGSLVKLN